MRNRLNFSIGTVLLALVLSLAWGCAQHKKGEGHYTCPMHPEVVRDSPGACPVCAMTLVRKDAQSQEVKISGEMSYLVRPTNAFVVSDVRTVQPLRESHNKIMSLNGVISPDTRKLLSVPVRFSGRIEKLWVKYNLQPVRKGQKILELYSEEIAAAQRDYLFLVKEDGENKPLIAAAKQKLILLGITEDQISRLSAGTVSYSVEVYSPADGYVTDGSPPDFGSLPEQRNKVMGSAMEAGKVRNTVPGTELQIREGMYVQSGETLFNVTQQSTVWAEFDVHQNDAKEVRTGDSLRIKLGGKEMVTTVNFIEPFYKEDEPFVKLRCYLTNTAGLRVGQLVTGTLISAPREAMWIPLSSAVDLGTRSIAFVKRKGVFRPRTIQVGMKTQAQIEVMGGLDPSDSVAYDARYLVDRESKIKTNN